MSASCRLAEIERVRAKLRMAQPKAQTLPGAAQLACIDGLVAVQL